MKSENDPQSIQFSILSSMLYMFIAINMLASIAFTQEVAYLSQLHENQVTIVNLDTGTVIGTIPFGVGGPEEDGPLGLAVTPDQSRIYGVTDGRDDRSSPPQPWARLMSGR